MLLAPVDGYILGAIGESCDAACSKLIPKASCDPKIDLNDSSSIFRELRVSCPLDNEDARNGTWWADDQPSFVAGKKGPSGVPDPNYHQCLGWKAIPAAGVPCSGSYVNTQRVCKCGPACAQTCWAAEGGDNSCGEPCLDNSSTKLTFGTGLSGAGIDASEVTIFAHKITPGHTAMMNHFWSTCSGACEASLTVRYYIDGETNASIEFHPGMAAGVGFNDDQAPWGTKWVGLGAGKGGGNAWFNNFKIPFTDSVKVTAQSSDGKAYGGFYMIVRGAMDVPLVIGDVTLPAKAKLQLQKFEGSMKPLEILDVVSVPKGRQGQVFLSALAVENNGTGGLNFLEGCYHMYDPADQAYPGTLLATGTEDFFDSGWYFNAGEFHSPVSGFTHLVSTKSKTEWSAYRFHEMDPLRFADGVKITWRCGDMLGPAGNGGDKCFTQETGGHPVGTPTCDNVVSYAWVYVWD